MSIPESEKKWQFFGWADHSRTAEQPLLQGSSQSFQPTQPRTGRRWWWTFDLNTLSILCYQCNMRPGFSIPGRGCPTGSGTCCMPWPIRLSPVSLWVYLDRIWGAASVSIKDFHWHQEEYLHPSTRSTERKCPTSHWYRFPFSINVTCYCATWTLCFVSRPTAVFQSAFAISQMAVNSWWPLTTTCWSVQERFEPCKLSKLSKLSKPSKPSKLSTWLCQTVRKVLGAEQSCAI